MSLRSMTGKKPQVKLRGSRLTQAQKRALRSARQLRLSGLSRAQKRAIRSAQLTAQRTAQTAQSARQTAQSARQTAQIAAQRTAERVGPTAGQARQMASTGVQNARVWSAPRLDRAGAYVEGELGPRVGSMLRRMAGRIEPTQPRPGRRGMAAALLAVGGALGAAGAIATRRNMARKHVDESEAPTERLASVSGDEGAEDRAHTS
ncbi:hypothetical protein GCM10023196_092470 [Actinoallomurus vinaceus]|uniref:DUF3618 domain-containing protein n=1 Tax=Actinoallomurus vinaceus TaxID=1080074 RepID=A0ABP8UR17_9ACTN